MLALKTHLTYEAQITLMSDRGFNFSDTEQVLATLKRLGYYRLSGYTLPLREPESDNFAPNAKFDDALKLYEFDKKLRNTLFEGLSELETSFRAQVAYFLGRRSAEGHLYPEFLDEISCAALDPTNGSRTVHEAWLHKFRKLESFAKAEAFVRHHKDVYEKRIPIWVATEFMDFGNTVKLFQLMKKEDRLEIAEFFGVSNDQAGVFESWMIALNDLRNKCSHHNRIWNSKSAIPKKPATSMVTCTFWHFLELDDEKLSRIYSRIIVLAYLLRSSQNSNTWSSEAKQTFLRFGTVFEFTVENSMGFPDRWESLTIWN